MFLRYGGQELRHVMDVEEAIMKTIKQKQNLKNVLCSHYWGDCSVTHLQWLLSFPYGEC